MLPRVVSLNVFLQYIEAVHSERVHSLDIDSQRHIVDYIFPIIYPALGRRRVPPNTITPELIIEAARFHFPDPTGVLRFEPPRVAPPSAVPVAPSPSPDAY